MEPNFNFSTGEELLALATKENLSLGDCMIQRELALFPATKDEVLNKMTDYYDTMKASVQAAMEDSPHSIGGLIGGEGSQIVARAQIHPTASGSLTSKAVGYAMGVLEVNASMGLVVAAPTGGSSGVIPGCFVALEEEYSFPKKAMVDALFAGGAIGYVIMRHASVSGAECGCQAEVGTASAMAAAGAVTLLGGTPAQALHGASYAISNLLGLVCDPVAGLVEVPCHGRNAIGAAGALAAADIALSGVPSPIPFDEVVDAMYRVGLTIPYELRETALGGLATSPSALRYQRECAHCLGGQ